MIIRFWSLYFGSYIMLHSSIQINVYYVKEYVFPNIEAIHTLISTNYPTNNPTARHVYKCINNKIGSQHPSSPIFLLGHISPFFKTIIVYNSVPRGKQTGWNRFILACAMSKHLIDRSIPFCHREIWPFPRWLNWCQPYRDGWWFNLARRIKTSTAARINNPNVRFPRDLLPRWCSHCDAAKLGYSRKSTL